MLRPLRSRHLRVHGALENENHPGISLRQQAEGGNVVRIGRTQHPGHLAGQAAPRRRPGG